MIVAVPVSENKGLDSRVSEKCARAPYILLARTGKGTMRLEKIMENPAPSFKHGAGPVFVKTLIDEKVEVVACPEMGESVSELLEEHGIKAVQASPGEKALAVLARLSQ